MSERFLLADNDALIKELVQTSLERRGFVIVKSVSSTAEIESLEPSEKITMAIVDDRMPRKGDGERAARLLRERFPGIRIISYSADRFVGWGDENVTKGKGPDPLFEAIARLQAQGS